MGLPLLYSFLSQGFVYDKMEPSIQLAEYILDTLMLPSSPFSNLRKSDAYIILGFLIFNLLLRVFKRNVDVYENHLGEICFFSTLVNLSIMATKSELLNVLQN